MIDCEMDNDVIRESLGAMTLHVVFLDPLKNMTFYLLLFRRSVQCAPVKSMEVGQTIRFVLNGGYALIGN